MRARLRCAAAGSSTLRAPRQASGPDDERRAEREPEVDRQHDPKPAAGPTPQAAWAGSPLDGDDDLAARAAFPQIPDRRRYLAQRKRLIDDGSELAGFEELAQLLQVLLSLRRDPRAQLLAHEPREHKRPELAVSASEPPSAPFSADDHERPLSGEGASEM